MDTGEMNILVESRNTGLAKLWFIFFHALMKEGNITGLNSFHSHPLNPREHICIFYFHQVG